MEKESSIPGKSMEFGATANLVNQSFALRFG
jgi:hypothetical protein